MTTPRRIALIAPLPPTKSGIARHSAAIAKALIARGDVDVSIWSFARQYPSILYPGDDETSPSLTPFDPQTRCLTGANPLTWTRTMDSVMSWKPDVVALPAWTFALAPALGWMARKAKRAGFEVVMVVHNAFDHETAGWKHRLSLWQLAQADRFVTHNAELASQLRDHFPEAQVDVFPHPVFGDLPDPAGSQQREAALELLFFGIVRPYKGLDVLLQALAESGRTDLRLTVAGEFWNGQAETDAFIAKLGLADRVTLIPGFASDLDTAELFNRADAVMLPYRSVTGSGVVATAYRYGRPVIASDLPGLADVVPDGTGWLVAPDDPSALAEIINGLDRDTTTTAGQCAAAFGRTLSWDRFADLVVG